MLAALGHRVTIATEWDGKDADLLLALHARRSHAAVAAFHRLYPTRPLVLALTGTDLYRDIRSDACARESMELAARMIVLQAMGLEELAPHLRQKTSVVYQSAEPGVPRRPPRSYFQVCVLGHLREEKDPFRAALALAHLPESSRIRVSQAGRPMAPEMELEARTLMATQPRYRWLGEVPHWRARRLLAQSHVMVISSRMEGGANVVSEALAAGVPVIASRISGNIGMLGADYPGYFPLENDAALAQLLLRAETEPPFYRALEAGCAARRFIADPSGEQAALAQVIESASSASPGA
jgi:putative glycosyltransferase (TIGR04348 family)